VYYRCFDDIFKFCPDFLCGLACRVVCTETGILSFGLESSEEKDKFLALIINIRSPKLILFDEFRMMLQDTISVSSWLEHGGGQEIKYPRSFLESLNKYRRNMTQSDPETFEDDLKFN
jgi:hypothetical protein